MASHDYGIQENVVEGKWVTPESERKMQERKKEAIKRKKEEEKIRKKHRKRQMKKAEKIKAKQNKASWSRFVMLFGCFSSIASSCITIVGASIFVTHYF